jgi:hypothetical protein
MLRHERIYCSVVTQNNEEIGPVEEEKEDCHFLYYFLYVYFYSLRWSENNFT